ncbi:MAG: methyltransferase [Bacteroidota bacterium]|nr:methyltransferase [Bacteroidota bacterium]
MPDNLFAFKQFSINQSHCAMKIGTDAVLLGALVQIHEPIKSILDIGTGTGLLALMLAQKSERYTDIHIDAIEIDKPACEQATENFNQSKWKHRLKAFNCSLQNFKDQQHQYDLIISNPPFFRFKKNIAIIEEQKSNARHDKALPFEELANHTNRLLKSTGKFWLILPMQEGTEFIKIARQENLYVSQQILVQPKPGKEPNRMVLCFVKVDGSIANKQLCIYDEKGNATKEYYDLTNEYLLWLNKKN